MADQKGQLQRDTEAHGRAMVESYKMEFEILKTQATLVTGALIAIIALSDVLVPDEPRFLFILGISGVLLLYSMGWALAGMLRLTTAVMQELSPYDRRTKAEKDEGKKGLSRSRWRALASFPVGLGLFGLYVWLNAVL